ncbi:MAG: hypothetical protein HIU57_05730 [Acidobacteria bacterium]|nr:hypothetical protein [Acidobacteriota bacterium]
MSAVSSWTVLITTSTSCYLIRLVGYLVAARWFAGERLQHINSLIPGFILGALAVAQAPVIRPTSFSLTAWRGSPRPTPPCGPGRPSRPRSAIVYRWH